MNCSRILPLCLQLHPILAVYFIFFPLYCSAPPLCTSFCAFLSSYARMIANTCASLSPLVKREAEKQKNVTSERDERAARPRDECVAEMRAEMDPHEAECCGGVRSERGKGIKMAQEKCWRLGFASIIVSLLPRLFPAPSSRSRCARLNTQASVKPLVIRLSGRYHFYDRFVQTLKYSNR